VDRRLEWTKVISPYRYSPCCVRFLNTGITGIVAQKCRSVSVPHEVNADGVSAVSLSDGHR
jgi:hypothetical protein